MSAHDDFKRKHPFHYWLARLSIWWQHLGMGFFFNQQKAKGICHDELAAKAREKLDD